MTRTLIWKETRETLIYLWIGLFVFIGLPVIASIQFAFPHQGRWLLETGQFVLTCGGILAVFIAVGATCRDLSPRLMDFWISRPVSPWRWMLIKFLVGWLIVESLTVLPLLMQSSHDQSLSTDARAFLTSLPFLFSAVYALAFLAGCLLRRTAHAAMLGMAAMLLIWFLPSVLTSLHWLDTAALWDRRATLGLHIRYALSMMILTSIALAAALLTAQRDWKIEAGQKLMYGAIAGAVLILFGSLSLKVGTNMPVLAYQDLRQGDEASALSMVGTSGIISVESRQPYREMGFYSVEIQGAQLHVGPRVVSTHANWDSNTAHALPARPDIRYMLRSDDDYENAGQGVESDTDKAAAMLYLAIDQRDGSELRRATALWTHPWRQAEARLYLHDHRAFVLERGRLAVLDLAEPLNPKLISDTSSVGGGGLNAVRWPDDTVVLELPQLPGVSARDRLETMIEQSRWWFRLEGDLLCSISWSDYHQHLVSYRLSDLSDNVARFKKIADKRTSPLESLFGMSQVQDAQLSNGLLYCSNYQPNQGRWDAANPSISVFDPQDGFKMVGHFAAQGAGLVHPLADGRAVVAGSKIFLIGPPPKR